MVVARQAGSAGFGVPLHFFELQVTCTCPRYLWFAGTLSGAAKKQNPPRGCNAPRGPRGVQRWTARLGISSASLSSRPQAPVRRPHAHTSRVQLAWPGFFQANATPALSSPSCMCDCMTVIAVVDGLVHSVLRLKPCCPQLCLTTS